MPRSKRDKKITLTKVKKRGRDGRTELIDKVRAAVDEHAFLYVLKFDALRSVGFNDVRREWRESSLFLGKNKLMALALGRTPEDEVHDNARRVSARLIGDAALLATSRPRKDVLGFFEKLATPQFACAGTLATKTVKIAAGTLPADKFPTSKLPELRKLGVEAEVRATAARPRLPLTPPPRREGRNERPKEERVGVCAFLCERERWSGIPWLARVSHAAPSSLSDFCEWRHAIVFRAVLRSVTAPTSPPRVHGVARAGAKIT